MISWGNIILLLLLSWCISPFVFKLIVALSVGKDYLNSTNPKIKEEREKWTKEKLYMLKQQHPDWSYQQIANYTGLSKSTVYYLIKQYEKEFREKIN